MQFLKLPAALRWTWVNCLIILVMMTVYRLLLLAIFSSKDVGELPIILGGLLRDAGVISFIGLFYLMLTFSPKLHPYKSRNGMRFSFIYFSFFALLLIFIFALDLVSIKTFGQRLSGTKFISLFHGNPKTNIFIGNFPIMPFVIGAILLLWNWWIVLDWLHSRLGMFTRADEKVVRFFWQGLSAILFFLLIMLSIYNTKSLELKDLSVGRTPETSLKANPVMTLLFN